MSLSHRYYKTLPRWGKRLNRRFIAAFGKPAGLWMPNDVTNKAYDFSSNGNIGTINSGITTISASFGSLMSGWSFPDTISGNILTLISQTIGYPLTMCAVAIPAAIDLTTVGSVMAFGASGNELCIATNGAGKWRIIMQWSSVSGLVVDGGTAVAGVPSLITAVFLTSSHRQLYVNQSLVTDSTASDSMSLPISGQFEFGNRFTADRHFGGTALLFAAFPGGFTAAQVSALYSSLLYGKPYSLFDPQISQRYSIRQLAGSSFRFRRTLSGLGTRTGTRQVMA